MDRDGARARHDARAPARERVRLPLDVLVPLAEKIASAIEAAHARKIVHRDIKPSNIMIVDDAGGQLLPKLLDLGVARLLNGALPLPALPRPAVLPEGTPLLTEMSAIARRPKSDATPRMRAAAPVRRHPRVRTRTRLTGRNAQIGSPPYMAPELWSDATQAGPAVDVYSLGVVLYEALAGRRPFVAETAEAYEELHRSAPVPPLGPDFSARLDRVFQRALAKRPEDRWRSALELAAALKAELETLSAARRAKWLKFGLGAATVVAAAGLLEYRSALQTRTANTIKTQAEVNDGRQALLHNEGADALAHLSEGYRLGDHSPAVEFMLARALQPRQAELARLTATSGRMWSATYSPDGKQIATSDERAAQIWDAETHQLLFTLPHGAEVYQAVYSPDGTKLVTAGGRAIRIWDPKRGVLLHELSAAGADGKPSDYYLVTLSPDGARVAAIDATGGLTHVWDAVTGALLAALHTDGSEAPCLAFSADGGWIATSGGNDALVFDTGTWTKVLTLGVAHVRRLSFDPTGPRLATHQERIAVDATSCSNVCLAITLRARRTTARCSADIGPTRSSKISRSSLLSGLHVS
jgi:hypothetical protein